MGQPLQGASLAAIAARLADPRAWEWRGAIVDWLASGYCLVFGPSGTRKTFTMVDWSLRVAAGLPVGPYRTRQGAVIYIAAEDRAGVEQRFVAASEAAGIGFDVPVYVVDRLGRADSADFADLVVDRANHVAGGQPIRMVVIDTLGASTSEGLNDDSVCARITENMIGIASRLGGASVVAVHHTGKDHERGARGAQVLIDRADTSIEMSRTPSGSKAVIKKQRNGRDGLILDIEFEGHRVSLAPLGKGETLVVARQEAGSPSLAAPVETRAARSERPLGKSATIALVALRRLGGDDGPIEFETWRVEAMKGLESRKGWFDAKKALFGG